MVTEDVGQVQQMPQPQTLTPLLRSTKFGPSICQYWCTLSVWGVNRHLLKTAYFLPLRKDYVGNIASPAQEPGILAKVIIFEKNLDVQNQAIA